MRLKVLLLLVVISAQIMSDDVFSQNTINTKDTVTASLKINSDLDTVYRSFNNTNMRILPPKGFVPFSNGRVSGFVNTGTAASIVGAQYPETPYVGFYDAMAQKAFNKAGNAELTGERSAHTYSGRPAKFYFYTLRSEGVKVRRILFFTGDEYQMVFLQANYPASFDALIRQIIMESFLTVEYE